MAAVRNWPNSKSSPITLTCITVININIIILVWYQSRHKTFIHISFCTKRGWGSALEKHARTRKWHIYRQRFCNSLLLVKCTIWIDHKMEAHTTQCQAAADWCKLHSVSVITGFHSKSEGGNNKIWNKRNSNMKTNQEKCPPRRAQLNVRMHLVQTGCSWARAPTTVADC